MRFQTLCYRYLFFDWLFRDASRGSRLERAAAWQHNKRQARWLPTYMRRWIWFGLSLCVAGAFFELTLAAPLLAALFYVPGVLAVPVNAVIGVAWIGLRALPSPG